LPALLAEPLSRLAEQMTSQPDAPDRDAARVALHLSALVGRLMPNLGWLAGERHAGAEPIVTGRRRPYDESTLRKRARALAQHGGTDLVSREVEVSVEHAVAELGTKAIAYTDIFDQIYWTKKPAYAAPIASRGNRLRAATYFGLTFVRPDTGAALAYAVSWHKPASPLQDALDAVHAEPRRATWLTATLRLHIWDRGGSGRPTLRWALARRIPYLTVTKTSTRWTRYRRPPRVHTTSKVPVFVLRDAAVARGGPKGAAPEEVIFPAHPRKGRASSKALRYRTGAPLSKSDLRHLDRVYKQRWPGNENPIKALVAVGFDRNLDRGLTVTSSRGTDGRWARLEARARALHDTIQAFALRPTPIPQAIREARRLFREKAACAKERAAIAAIPKEKGARMPKGAELLCKNLMLLLYNRLALLLMRSPIDEARTMTPARVHELVLGRSPLAATADGVTTLWIDPVPSAPERVLQAEIVRLFNEQPLSLQGRPLHLRLRDPTDPAQVLEPIASARPLRVFG
jgi:hypothetical protein